MKDLTTDIFTQGQALEIDFAVQNFLDYEKLMSEQRAEINMIHRRYIY